MPKQSKPLSGQVAVVTGASRGIGKAIAVELARAGANVVVAARSSETAASKLPGTIEETAREVEAAGARALALALDVTDEAQVQAMAERTLDAFGRVDILVNNAGISFPAPFSETPLKRWDLVVNVNLRGPVMCAQALLPQMLERGSGCIVNISSYLSQVMLPGMISYSVSKAGLEKLTEYMGVELRSKGIAVSALRIELNIATEGWMFRNPDVDYSSWEKPDAAAEATLWLVQQGLSCTGRVLTIEEIRHRMTE